MDTDGKERLRQNSPTPHHGGRPKRMPYILIGLALIFCAAIVLMWMGGESIERPGADPGTVQKAPAD